MWTLEHRRAADRRGLRYPGDLSDAEWAHDSVVRQQVMCRPKGNCGRLCTASSTYCTRYDAIERGRIAALKRRVARSSPIDPGHQVGHGSRCQRTALINAILAHLAEFEIVAQIGRNGVAALLGIIGEHEDSRLPEVTQLHLVKRQILTAPH